MTFSLELHSLAVFSEFGHFVTIFDYSRNSVPGEASYSGMPSEGYNGYKRCLVALEYISTLGFRAKAPSVLE